MSAMRSPLMSPVTPLPITPADFISSARRHVGGAAHTPFNTATSSTASTMNQLISPSDEMMMKKNRRRSRILELQRANYTSPSTPPEKRRSAQGSVMTNAQITDLYTNCVKLSAENKINAKNAFGLPLIDYLSELFKKESDNFQMAGSTLDASAKIYAGRVDAIHSETYKVLTGLGRGNDRNDKDAGREDGDEDEDGNGRKRKIKRKKKNVKETNLNKINKKEDKKGEVHTAIEDYPYTHKAAANFEEGSGGMYLNHWSCVDDSCFVILSDGIASSTNPENNADDNKSIDTSDDVTELASQVIDTLHICPEFATFSMSNWSDNGEDGYTSIIARMEKENNNRRFDIDAEVELPAMIADAPDDDNYNDMDDFTGHDDDHIPGDDPTQSAIVENPETRLIETAITNMKQGSFGELMQVLTSGSTDYSYLKTNILNSWAGPEHWKVKPKSRDEKTKLEDKERRKRKRKEPFKIVFDADDEKLEKLFKETRQPTTLTKKTLTKNSKQRTTLPEDLQYELENLVKLPVQSKAPARLSGSLDDGGLHNYDYNNDNDKENFVPDFQGDEDDEEDMDGGGFDFTGDGLSQDLPASQDVPSQDDPNTSIFRGDNLVSQPQLVAKIDIGYAKTAKKVDVKKLKSSMWNLLSVPEPGAEKDKEEAPVEPQPGPSGEGTKSVTGQHHFTRLVQDLPSKISKTMAKNLSVPIAFVCLLHLANEKTLKIEGEENMADLMISQGLLVGRPST